MIRPGTARPWGAAIVIAAVLGLVAALYAADPALPQAKDAVEAPPAATEPSAEPPPEALLEAIARRGKELDRRAADLDREAERLQAMEREIRGLVERFSTLRADQTHQSDQSEQQQKDREAERFARLAKTYEAMAPDDAAARIDRMNERFALKLLAGIKPKAAAKILSGLDPGKAARLSERLAKPRQ